jgi:hypothetical protein
MEIPIVDEKMSPNRRVEMEAHFHKGCLIELGYLVIRRFSLYLVKVTHLSFIA